MAEEKPITRRTFLRRGLRGASVLGLGALVVAWRMTEAARGQAPASDDSSLEPGDPYERRILDELEGD